MYNSQAVISGTVGKLWRADFDSQLYPYISTEFGINIVSARRPNGKIYQFQPGPNGTWTSDADIRDQVQQTATGWDYHLVNGSIEHYDSSGRLVGKTTPSGLTTSYTYATNGNLEQIVGPFGHRLTLAYNSVNNRVSTITDNAGYAIQYAYSGGNNLLTRVTYPDNTAKRYHYGNSQFPNFITGISYIDSNNVTTRYSTYGYDTTGKAILTQHAQTDNGAPQETFTLSYDTDTQTTVTDAVGTQEVMTFATNLEVKNLISKVNQSDGKSLEQAFDANNNLTCRKDEEGRVTTYAYNATNQKTALSEGLTGDCSNPPASTVTHPETRTTTYQYLAPSLDLPTVISAPSVAAGQVKTTTIQYTDARFPMLPTVITQAGFTPAGTPVSRSVGLAYNSVGQVISIDGPRTDVADVTTLAYYDCTTGGACGQLKQVTNALGHITTYDSYDANGRLLQTTDPNGLRTSHTYDPRGRVSTISRIPASGPAALWQYAYTPWGDVAQVIDPDGVTLTYGYDAAHDLRTVTDAAGNQIRYAYDLKGNRTQDYTYDPGDTLVRQVDIAYDLRNRVSAINAAGSLTQQINDAVGNLTQSTDPNQNPPTTNSFDALNRLVQTLNSLGGTTTYAYDANDRLQQVVAPNNATTQYQYDDLGNLLQEVSPDRGTTVYTYDAAGNVTSVTDASGATTSYTYDALNRVTSIDYPGTDEDVTYTYDTLQPCSYGIGRLCSRQDESGTTIYAYDPFGNVVQHTHTELGVNYTTTYEYDAANRITRMVYPGGREVRFHRDDANHRLSGIEATVNGTPATLLSDIAYRADGRVTYRRFGNAVTDTRTYDLQGRLQTLHLGLPGFADVGSGSWAEDFIQAVYNAGITSGCGGGNFCPDDAVTRAQMAVFLLRAEHGSAYTPPPATGTVFADVPAGYWAAAWIEALSAEGLSLAADGTDGCGGGNYCPDDVATRAQMAVFLLRAEHGSGYTPPPASGLFADVPPSDPAAPWIEALYNEGLTNGCGGGNYCPDDPVTRAQTAVFLVRTFDLPRIPALRTYHYDPNGNVTQIERQGAPARLQAYDALDRLTEEGPEAGATTFLDYDPNGNRLQRRLDSLIETYGYGPTPSWRNLLESVGGVAIGHDAAGRHTTSADATYDYAYNAAGRLEQVLETGTPVATYAYNAHGLRTRKVLPGNAITVYHHDPQGRLLAETTATGTLARAYVWADAEPIAQIDRDPASGVETLTYLHTDRLATPRLATRAGEGIVVWALAEDEAFGATPPRPDFDRNGEPTPVNLRFPGQYFDEETGLHYNWHRYYDPRIGRYITADPVSVDEHVMNMFIRLRSTRRPIIDVIGKPDINDPGSFKSRGIAELGQSSSPLAVPLELNPYVYVANNPLRWTDPTGLSINFPGDGMSLLPAAPSGPICATKKDCEEALKVQKKICDKVKSGRGRLICLAGAYSLYAACLASATD